MGMGSSLTVEFRDARTNPAFANRYVTAVLRPGVKHPAEGAYLYNADHQFLSAAGAVNGLGRALVEIAQGETGSTPSEVLAEAIQEFQTACRGSKVGSSALAVWVAAFAKACAAASAASA
jgi:hypothetical protein